MGLDRNLCDRHIGVWKHVCQRHPSPVIKPSLLIRNHVKPDFTQKGSCFVRYLWRTWCPVAKAIHGFGETIKIVNGLGAVRSGNRNTRGLPMGGDHQNCRGFFQRRAILAEKLASRAILQQYHWRTVRDEKTWHAGHTVDLGGRFFATGRFFVLRTFGAVAGNRLERLLYVIAPQICDTINVHHDRVTLAAGVSFLLAFWNSVVNCAVDCIILNHAGGAV